MIGGIIVGRIIDKVSSRDAVWFNLLLVFLTYLCIIIFLLVDEYSWLAYLMTFMYGLHDSAINTHTLQMLGSEFDTNSEPFSVFTLLEAATAVILLFVASFLEKYRTEMIYFGILGIAGLLMCGTTLTFDFKKRNKKGEGKIGNIGESTVTTENMMKSNIEETRLI